MLHWLANVTEQASQATSTGGSHLPLALVRRVGQMALTPLYLLYEKRLLSQVRRGPVPRHVGLILDGNRRYGRQHNLSDPLEIYTAGAAKLDDLLSWCADLTI